MFLTWTGYEIDGSDTNFDLVLPESEQTLDLVTHLIQLPIFDTNEFSFYDDENKHLSWESFKEKLLTRSFERLKIEGHFKAFDLLDEATQQDFQQISQQRNPPEPSFSKTRDPAPAPTRFAGMMELSIIRNTSNMAGRYASYDRLEKGYERNIPFFLDDISKGTAFELWVPVGSTYEYFIYLMNQLTQRFPSLATSGGLDCGGGWTEGCTYSDYLYRFEKIQIPLQYGVRHFLKKMVSHGITSYQERFLKTARKRIFDFILLNNEEDSERKVLLFNDYVEHIEEQLQQAENAYDAICRTATPIWLPLPEEFESDTFIHERLLPLAAKLTAYNDTGYLGFYKEGDRYFAEFRVNSDMKDYFAAYLDLMRLDAFTDIKEKMYLERQAFEKNRPPAYQIVRKKKGSKK